MIGAFAVLSFVVSSVAAQKSSLSIPLHQKGSTLSNNGVANLSALAKERARVLGKYHKGSAARQARPRSNHRVYGKRQNEPLTPDSDQEALAFFGELTVGTPGETFDVLFDTGSSDIWVAGSACSTGCDGLKRYDPAASSTSTDQRRTAQLLYDDGSSVSGDVYTDSVSVAGINSAKQVLISATQSTGQLADHTVNGLMGLGFDAISRSGSTNFVGAAFDQGQIPSPVFSLGLKTSPELYIGGVNPQKYDGDFTCTPVTEQRFWKVQGQAGPNPSSLSYTGPMIIDSGTTLIVGDSASVQAFYAGVPGAAVCSDCGAGFYTVPCNQMPTPTFMFEGRAFTISAEDFSWGKVSSGPDICIAALTSSGDATDGWVVGHPLFKSVYTKFDFGNANVCFATPA